MGRLDYESEGLLLLTNDGLLQHKLSNPKYEHPRSYWVQVEQVPTQETLNKLQDGVIIKGGYHTKPAQVSMITTPLIPQRIPPIRQRQHIPTQWLKMQLIEGKNRQVRRMTAAVGHPTLRLIRHQISCGSACDKDPNTFHFTLEDLQPGTWRNLEPFEIEVLQKVKAKS